MLLCRFWECRPKNLHVRVASRRIHDRAEMYSNLHSPFSRSLLQNSDSKRLKSQAILCSWLLAPVSSSHATRLFLTISTWSWKRGEFTAKQQSRNTFNMSCSLAKFKSAAKRWNFPVLWSQPSWLSSTDRSTEFSFNIHLWYLCVCLFVSHLKEQHV